MNPRRGLAFGTHDAHGTDGYSGSRLRSAPCVLVLFLAFALPPGVYAQSAWVPGDGHGAISLAVGTLTTDKQILYDGSEASAGKSTARILFLNLDYGITDKLAVSVAIPFIEKKYEGNRPHVPAILDDPALRDIPFLDDGEYHGHWQDLSVKLRYNLRLDPVAITPFVSYSTPSSDYVFFAQSAIGTQQNALTAGIDFGQNLPPPFQNLYWQGGYGYTWLERERDVKVDYSTIKLEFGWYLSPRWSVKLLGHWQKTHDGLDFPKDFIPNFRNDRWYHHDQTQRIDYLNLGVGADFRINDHWGLFATYGRTVDGENTYKIDPSIAIGVSRGF